MIAPTDADLQALAAALGVKLSTAARRLGTAESCTGGWIAKACTDVPGSSRWLAGGVVSYSNEAKAALLGVEAGLMDRHGAVSEAVVRAMADGALERLACDVSVAVSGVAGPDGGTADKPVGTVWFAWAIRDASGAVSITAARETFCGDRETVRRLSVQRALEGLLAQ